MLHKFGVKLGENPLINNFHYGYLFVFENDTQNVIGHLSMVITQYVVCTNDK